MHAREQSDGLAHDKVHHADGAPVQGGRGRGWGEGEREGEGGWRGREKRMVSSYKLKMSTLVDYKMAMKASTSHVEPCALHACYITWL